MRRDVVHKCIECGAVLPFRYKGRQRIYCGNTCRKNYTSRKKSAQDFVGYVDLAVLLAGST